MYDLVDAPGRYVDILGEAILADPKRGEELLLKNLSGVDGRSFLTYMSLRPVIVC